MVGFLREKPEQDREFRSEDLQEENNEREARERQHNQLIIQKSTNASSAKSGSPSLAATSAKTLALLLQRQ